MESVVETGEVGVMGEAFQINRVSILWTAGASTLDHVDPQIHVKCTLLRLDNLNSKPKSE